MNPPVVCLYPDIPDLVFTCALCGHVDTPELPVLWETGEWAFVCLNRSECVRRQNERKVAS